MKRLHLFILALTLSFIVMGQDNITTIKNETNDIEPTFVNETPLLQSPIIDLNSAFKLDSLEYNTTSSLEIPIPKSITLQKRQIPGDPYSLDYNEGGIIKGWNSGYIFGSNSFTTYPTIGSFGMASIGATQTFGKFTLTGSVSAHKYNLVRNIQNNFSFSGNASYRINNTFTFNVFGSYQTNNYYSSMAAMPYLPQSNYGASMTTNFSEKFGADLGVQRYYDPYSHRWITTPIVAPFYKIGKQKIGFDFGGLLKNIFEGAFNSNDYDYGTPANERKVSTGGGNNNWNSRRKDSMRR